MRPEGPRPTIIGPDSGPEAPFPLRMKGKVVSGFGRGSKEVRPYLYTAPRPLMRTHKADHHLSQLGIPTANIPVEGVSWIDEAQSGVYFGWAGIQLPASHPSLESSTPPPPPPKDKAA